MELSRKDIQNFYVRICKDSGWKIDYINAAKLAAGVLSLNTMEIWIAIGDLKTMEKISKGEHPVCRDYNG